MNGVEAVVPAGGYDEQKLQEFVARKRAWIIKTAGYYGRLRQITGYEESSASNAIYYLGKRYRMHLVKDVHTSFVISDVLGTVTFHITDMRSYKREIEQWYKEQTAKLISERLPVIATRLGLHYNKFLIKNQKSRWASCSKKRNLNFNLLLSAAPLDVIDYVIVHELCHISEMNHSKKFWQLVQSADPLYKEHKEWLQNHSAVIGVQGL
jgi:predicted metal-dependent hydrolase